MGLGLPFPAIGTVGWDTARLAHLVMPTPGDAWEAPAPCPHLPCEQLEPRRKGRGLSCSPFSVGLRSRLRSPPQALGKDEAPSSVGVGQSSPAGTCILHSVKKKLKLGRLRLNMWQPWAHVRLPLPHTLQRMPSTSQQGLLTLAVPLPLYRESPTRTRSIGFLQSH